MEFVAFDVETANRSRGSICAVGYAIVTEGEVTETGSWLVNPGAEVEFDPWNVRIHGIHPEHVVDATSIRDALAELSNLIGDRIAVAHNAPFDVGAIREAAISNDFSPPTFDYLDTLVVARRELALISYRLPIVAEALGVPLERHHAAADDAATTAGIALRLAERRGADSIANLAKAMRIQLGRLAPLGEVNRGSRAIFSRSSSAAGTPDPNTDASPDHHLYGKHMVFTGALGVPRQQAWEWAADVGAIPQANVTKRTNILVMGDGFVGDNLDEFGTGKAKKAVTLLEKGQQIEVMNESDFITYLSEAADAQARDHER